MLHGVAVVFFVDLYNFTSSLLLSQIISIYTEMTLQEASRVLTLLGIAPSRATTGTMKHVARSNTCVCVHVTNEEVHHELALSNPSTVRHTTTLTSGKTIHEKKRRLPYEGKQEG